MENFIKENLKRGSMISMGYIETKDGMYRLSKYTIKKIKKYLASQ